ncbi:MAG TPA: MBL fold metallo-hydrolase [Verrucomicrobiae bacterium]
MSKQFAPSLIIVDVGHGNASVLLDSKGVVVFDTGKGPELLEFLHSSRIHNVKRLILSHSDDDHIGNASRLLLDDKIKVSEVYFNSDPSKDTDSHQQLQIAILTARRQRKTIPNPGLCSSLTGKLNCGDVSIEVLYPPAESLVSGVGGRNVRGKRNTSNSLSAAIRLSYLHKPLVLLGGDVGFECLDFWDAERMSAKAEVMVFPHHGGSPGDGDAATFAEAVLSKVSPKYIVFSIHRSRFNLPREDIVNCILNCNPKVKMLCTQLPERLQKDLTKVAAWSLHRSRRKIGKNMWWEGTICVQFKNGKAKVKRHR